MIIDNVWPVPLLLAVCDQTLCDSVWSDIRHDQTVCDQTSDMISVWSDIRHDQSVWSDIRHDQTVCDQTSDMNRQCVIRHQTWSDSVWSASDMISRCVISECWHCEISFMTIANIQLYVGNSHRTDLTMSTPFKVDCIQFNAFLRHHRRKTFPFQIS